MIEGHIHPDFWPVARVLEQQLKRAPRAGGAAVAVYHRGELVVDIRGGTRDAAGSPWSPDTMSVSFSTTKGVLSTLVHRLVDQGLLDYDDPVAKFWPEFAQNGKEDVTLRHLLCHQAGLYDIRHLVDGAHRMRDWEYMTGRLAAATPVHRPGAMSAYHGLTYGWLVGEVAQRVTGRSVSDLVQSEIARPLQLDGLYIGVPDEQLDRVATLVSPRERLARVQRLEAPLKRLQRALSFVNFPIDAGRMAAALAPHGIESFDWSAPETLRACIPAANGTFTARALAKMYATLAAGGELDGFRLLSEETLRRATEVQTRKIDKVVPFPMHWRLGYHRAATTRGNPARGFGHYGFGGSGAWADPDSALAVALILNSGLGTPFGDIRTAQVGGAALLCARRR
jgi:CubicO group peptidase (beta-lactamase class C family)